MSRADDIRMAREAGLPEIIDNANKPWAELADFAELIRADEREACAKVCQEMKGQCWAYDHDTIAAAIRAKGNQ